MNKGVTTEVPGLQHLPVKWLLNLPGRSGDSQLIWYTAQLTG